MTKQLMFGRYLGKIFKLHFNKYQYKGWLRNVKKSNIYFILNFIKFFHKNNNQFYEFANNPKPLNFKIIIS